MRRVISQRSTIAALILAFIPLTSAYAIHYQGPLVVNDAYIKKHGRVIVGNFAGTVYQPALVINTTTPVLITDSNFTGPGDLIYGSNVDVSVTNSTGIATNPNIYGAQKGFFVHIEGAINLNVQNNTATGSRFGVYINSFKGTATPTQTIKILKNVFNNIDARPSDGNGGYITSGEWNGHAIQFNQVHSTPYTEIGWNQIINTPRQSQCSDLINMYQSSGTSGSPILIHDNYLQGAFPASPGPNKYTGGGIITDGSASDTAASATAFVNMYNNQVVATANYGLSIAAGHDNAIYNNRIVSSGYLSDGTFYPTTFGNGINNYNNYKQPVTTMFNDIAYNNVSGLVRRSSDGSPMRADWYLPNQTTGTNSSFTPNDVNNPNLAAEAAEYQTWIAKLTSNGIVIGSSQ